MLQILHGDCLELLPSIHGIDACVCDPPYGLKFMGKNWDHGIPGVPYWQAIMASCKPGAHLLAFGGTRTFHRLALAIEDAGWEIRDTIMWVYGSGFPKSLNLDGEWNAWGTALKPAWEPIILARKPLDGTVAQNVQKYGCGALNIDACRVEGVPGNGVWGSSNEECQEGRTFNQSPNGKQYRSKPVERPLRIPGHKSGFADVGVSAGSKAAGTTTVGRWPANLIHDGSEEVMTLFPSSAGACAPVLGTEPSENHKSCYSKRDRVPGTFFGYEGSAARFFYCAKASKSDRDEGCESIEPVKQDPSRKEGNLGGDNPRNRGVHERANYHPTVKPTDLMRYLCKLVTPPGGVIFDPFMGSGSTGKAAVLEGFQFVGIDKEAEYVKIAEARIRYAQSQYQPTLL